MEQADGSTFVCEFAGELTDTSCHRDEFARHHDDRHSVLLRADLGDHLHAPQFESGRILHNDLSSIAQLLGGVEFGLGLMSCARFSRRASASCASAESQRSSSARALPSRPKVR